MNPRGSRRRLALHRGVALIVSLVMLALISLTAMAVMRAAQGVDSAASSMRIQLQAQQAAELALRWCERQLLQPNPAVTVHEPPDTGALWERFDNWSGSMALAATVPAELLSGAASPSYLPQCLAERRVLPGGGEVVDVTARGFSHNYQPDALGRTRLGAAAWSQSTVLLAPIEP